MFMDGKAGDKLETFQLSTTMMLRGLEHTLCEKAKGTWHIQPGEQLNLEGAQEQLSSTYEKHIKMTVPGSSQWPSGKGTKDSGSKLKQETQTGYKELSRLEDKQTGFPERLCLSRAKWMSSCIILCDLTVDLAWSEELPSDILLTSIPTWISLFYPRNYQVHIVWFFKHFDQIFRCLKSV